MEGNNVFRANVSCIVRSLPHTHDVALRVLLQVGLHHPRCVLAVSHDSAKGGRCGEDWPSPVPPCPWSEPQEDTQKGGAN